MEDNSIKKYNPIGFLSNFSLKIIAIICMTIDHIGLILFPNVTILRIIGRISFPIIAYLIAEGCHHTKNKLKRLLIMVIISVIYMIFYYVYSGMIMGSIFINFSFSILFIYLLNDIKKCLFNKKYINFVILSFVFILLMICTYKIHSFIIIDYGFTGMLVPIIISLFDFKDINVGNTLRKFDCFIVRIICFGISLIFVCITSRMREIQYYCFLAIIPLLFYNGKNGYSYFKYGFYMYYPIHLLILEVIDSII